MSISRRAFLGFGQLLVAAAALPLKVFGSDWSASPRLYSMTRETFLPLVNSSFGVRIGGSVHTWLTLLSVEDMTPSETAAADLKSAHAPQVSTFALHFIITGDALPQGEYQLEHRRLGTFPLFIVPSSKHDARPTYTAIFNHFVPGTTGVPVPPAPKKR